MKIVLFDGDYEDERSHFDKAIEKALGTKAVFQRSESELVTDEAVISEVESNPEEYSRLRISEIPDNITDLVLLTAVEWEDWEEIDMIRTCIVIYAVDGKIHHLT